MTGEGNGRRNYVEITCTNYYLIYFGSVRFGSVGEFTIENRTEPKFSHQFGWFETVFSVRTPLLNSMWN